MTVEVLLRYMDEGMALLKTALENVSEEYLSEPFAASIGVLVSIASDAHGPDGFALLEDGVTQARRGWLGPAQVLNARPLGELRALLRRTMR